LLLTSQAIRQYLSNYLNLLPFWQPLLPAGSKRHLPTPEQRVLYRMLDTEEQRSIITCDGTGAHRIITILYYLSQHPEAVWMVNRNVQRLATTYTDELHWSSKQVVMRQSGVAGITKATMLYGTVLFDLDGARLDKMEAFHALTGKRLLFLAAGATKNIGKVQEFCTTVQIQVGAKLPPCPIATEVAMSYHFAKGRPGDGAQQSAPGQYTSFWRGLGTHVVCCAPHRCATTLWFNVVRDSGISTSTVVVLGKLLPDQPGRILMPYPGKIREEAPCVTDLVLIDPDRATAAEYRSALGMIARSAHKYGTVYVHHIFTQTTPGRQWRGLEIVRRYLSGAKRTKGAPLGVTFDDLMRHTQELGIDATFH
jgi:hypothetical protein